MGLSAVDEAQYARPGLSALPGPLDIVDFHARNFDVLVGPRRRERVNEPARRRCRHRSVRYGFLCQTQETVTDRAEAKELAAEADKLDERSDKLAGLFTTDGDKKFLESLMSPQRTVLGGGVADLVDEHGCLMLTLDSLLKRALETRAALGEDKPFNLNHNRVLQLVMTSEPFYIRGLNHVH